MLSGGLAIAMRHVDLMLNGSKYDSESINWHSVWMPFKVLPTKRGEKTRPAGGSSSIRSILQGAWIRNSLGIRLEI